MDKILAKQGFICDMDGVIYHGKNILPGAKEFVNWMIEKFDYRNKDADWKNSKDAIQRGMQKLKGGYPADPIYQRKN